MTRLDVTAQRAYVPNRHLISALKLPAGVAWAISPFANTAANFSGHGTGTTHAP